MSSELRITLPVPRPWSYPIVIDSGLIEQIPTFIHPKASTTVIITDNRVKKHYAPALLKALSQTGHKTLLLSFPAGERSKVNRTKARLEETMLTEACDRDTVILALGGGVVGDMAGFIAATYLRGIAYLQIPTTLLAMLDSSVGGKTGLDTAQGKNLIGAFWQPQAVISDIQTLKTLPKKHLINGLIEAFKMFLTHDVKSLHELDHELDLILNYDETTLIKLIHRAVSIKADVVMQDEKEQNQRAVLNFGHTIGHALEHLSNYKLLHGYAVALGLIVEAKIAVLMGLLSERDYQFIEIFLQRLHITRSELKQFDVNAILQATQLDKKKRAGAVHYVLLKKLGNVYEHAGQYTHPVSEELVRRAFTELNHS